MIAHRVQGALVALFTDLTYIDSNDKSSCFQNHLHLCCSHFEEVNCVEEYLQQCI